MPTKRFEMLKEDKRRDISEAIYAEFLKTPYGEIRMNQIAQRANISRASLYTYFQDKEDMLFLVLDQMWKSFLEYNKQIIMENRGDFFKVMLMSLQYQLKLSKTNHLFTLLYIYGGNSFYKENFRIIKDKEYEAHKDWLYENLCDKYLKELKKDDINTFFEICRSLIVDSVLKSLYDFQGDEKIIIDFKKKLNLLREKLLI